MSIQAINGPASLNGLSSDKITSHGSILHGKIMQNGDVIGFGGINIGKIGTDVSHYGLPGYPVFLVDLPEKGPMPEDQTELNTLGFEVRNYTFVSGEKRYSSKNRFGSWFYQLQDVSSDKKKTLRCYTQKNQFSNAFEVILGVNVALSANPSLKYNEKSAYPSPDGKKIVVLRGDRGEEVVEITLRNNSSGGIQTALSNVVQTHNNETWTGSDASAAGLGPTITSTPDPAIDYLISLLPPAVTPLTGTVVVRVALIGYDNSGNLSTILEKSSEEYTSDFLPVESTVEFLGDEVSFTFSEVTNTTTYPPELALDGTVVFSPAYSVVIKRSVIKTKRNKTSFGVLSYVKETLLYDLPGSVDDYSDPPTGSSITGIKYYGRQYAKLTITDAASGLKTYKFYSFNGVIKDTTETEHCIFNPKTNQFEVMSNEAETII